ncbi:hypothetical protein A4X17_18145 [Plantibacter sp. H53]|uniref:DUF4012 domain-containing protein n=1 Tax=Plantibacter sp. H53 TaxID=1827323 RepID=UPI0007DA2AA4|nr:DUF4012 domain-containing protein [Plantibacter sp. H53]OAN29649.1 hypothetical protein A4X17_18145 [Plantibacter sp. H53]
MADPRPATAGIRLPGRRRSRLWWIALAVLLVVLALGAWLGVRASLAKNALEAAQSEAKSLQSAVLDGDASGTEATQRALTTHTGEAVSLTSDPIWRAAEAVPFLGVNFSAVRQAAAATDDVAVDVVPKVVAIADQVNLSSLLPGDGSIATEPLRTVAPTVAEAAAAADTIAGRVDTIGTDGALPVVADAVEKLTRTITGASTMLDTAARATALLPDMAGGAGPRNIMVMIQNNAELRSSGGIAGAVALLHAENGVISFVGTRGSDDFSGFPAPVLPLTPFEQNVYTDNLGRYIQDTNLTVDFSRTGELAAAMGTQVFGVPIDTVVAVDPYVLAHLLEATGPVNLPDGTELTADNAAKTLLSDVYARFPDRLVQDAFFAAVSGEVFEGMISRSPDPGALVQALSASGAENRLHVWSAVPTEQALIAETSLAGIPPATDDAAVYTGVYLEDLTRAKMDYYLETKVDIRDARCTKQGAEYVVAVTLTSTAPADAATSLPDYVTAGGRFGTPAGDIATRVVIHGPLGASLLGASDGEDLPVKAVTDPNGRLYAQTDVTLTPGATTELVFTVLAPKASDVPPNLVTTPGITGKTTISAFPRCGS